MSRTPLESDDGSVGAEELKEGKLRLQNYQIGETVKFCVSKQINIS